MAQLMPLTRMTEDELEAMVKNAPLGMNVFVPFYFFVLMTMVSFIVAVNMGMAVGMRMLVSMDQIAVTMGMGVDKGARFVISYFA